MKNVVLVKLYSFGDIVTPPLGLGYLLKVLKEIDGVNPIFIDACRDEISNDQLLDTIKELQPLLIGFQVYSMDYVAFCDLIPKIRKFCPKTTIVAGGSHVSSLPKETLTDNPCLDFVVKGEGEEALRLLVLNLLGKSNGNEMRDIPNLVYRNGKSIVQNKSEWVDVDKYGAPAWDLLEPEKYPARHQGSFHKSTKATPIVTSRGCPYSCTFCAGHLVTGKRIRRREIKSVVDEIAFLNSHYGFEEFIIQDENFSFYKDHVIGLSAELKRRNIKCYFSFPSGLRLDKIDEEIVDALKQMGTYAVTVGIESGSSRILKSMKKNLNLDMVKQKIRLLKKSGMLVKGNFIWGFYNETLRDVKKSVDFAIKSGVDTAVFSNYFPFPGSENFKDMIHRGELKLNEIDWNAYAQYYSRIPYHPKAMSEKELIKAIQWAVIRFYCRPLILAGLLRRMTRMIFLKNLLFKIVHLFGQRAKGVSV